MTDRLPTKTLEQATAAARKALVGFAAPREFGAHIFHVSIGRGLTVLTEKYGTQGGAAEHYEEHRAAVSRELWAPIAAAAREEFNPRIVLGGGLEGDFKPGTAMDRMIGRELAVLMWAAEHSTVEQIDGICAAWASLQPEDRWWLYAMTAADGGELADRNRGWRKALHAALSDMKSGVKR